MEAEELQIIAYDLQSKEIELTFMIKIQKTL